MSALEKRSKRLRKASGTVKVNSRLVSFLYELMRDYVTPGKVESVMLNSTEPNVVYTNGYLARYATNVAKELMKK